MSEGRAAALDPNTEQRLVEHGKRLLESFHAAYASEPIGRETEFRRGLFTEWRHALDLLFGRAIAQRLTDTVSKLNGLSVDGESYVGFDSGAHMGYVGKLPPE